MRFTTTGAVSAGALQPIMSRVSEPDTPLSPVSARFPLGLGTHTAPASAEPPSKTGARPLSLRFVQPRPAAPALDTDLPPWRFCPDLQIALVDDDSGEAWFRRLEAAGTGSKATTGPSPDGGAGAGNEEWTPDYMGDASA